MTRGTIDDQAWSRKMAAQKSGPEVPGRWPPRGAVHRGRTDRFGRLTHHRFGVKTGSGGRNNRTTAMCRRRNGRSTAWWSVPGRHRCLGPASTADSMGRMQRRVPVGCVPVDCYGCTPRPPHADGGTQMVQFCASSAAAWLASTKASVMGAGLMSEADRIRRGLRRERLTVSDLVLGPEPLEISANSWCRAATCSPSRPAESRPRPEPGHHRSLTVPRLRHEPGADQRPPAAAARLDVIGAAGRA